MWPFKRKAEPTPEPAPAPRRAHLSSTSPRTPREMVEAYDRQNQALATVPAGAITTDGVEDLKPIAVPRVPEAIGAWYASQVFIGYPMCAVIAQNWLVDKACTMPARDAIRKGFTLLTYSEASEGEIDPDLQKKIEERVKRADKSFKLSKNMVDFVRLGRVYGIRLAIFKIEGASDEFYANPFNIDGVKPGSYRGISQVDPQWCAPLLSEEAASDPASQHFYEPEWWLIRGRKYHRSHLVIFRNGELPDILRPSYMYGGISVPQRIYERVYAAERTANEAPQLAMSKRTSVMQTDLTALYTDQEATCEAMNNFAYYRDNYGIKLIDSDDTYSQHDTSLADFDAVTMTQYQIVAAAAGVPATKLLGTTPKGFNSSGGYEEASYHEELEAIQAHDLTPLVDRHHELVMRSVVEPDLALEAGSIRIEIDWNPVDSPDAKEVAEIGKIEADRDAVLIGAGVIDAADARRRLRADQASGFADIADLEGPELPGENDDFDLGGIM